MCRSLEHNHWTARENIVLRYLRSIEQFIMFALHMHGEWCDRASGFSEFQINFEWINAKLET